MNDRDFGRWEALCRLVEHYEGQGQQDNAAILTKLRAERDALRARYEKEKA